MKIFLSVLTVFFLLSSPALANTVSYEGAFALYQKEITGKPSNTSRNM